MRIRIYNGSPRERDIARAAARFVLEDVFTLSPQKNRNTTIYIRFINNPKEDFYGCAYTPAVNSYNSRSYTVIINTSLIENVDELLETLMHELVHVAQMAHRTVLRYSYKTELNEYRAYWKGKLYNPDKAYSRQPWERHAYYWESKLVKAFVEKHLASSIF